MKNNFTQGSMNKLWNNQTITIEGNNNVTEWYKGKL